MDSFKHLQIAWLTLSLLLGYVIHTEGVVILSPSETAPVCNGDQLKVMCTVTGNGSFLEWNITLVGSATVPNTYTRVFSAGGPNSVQRPVTINSTMISFIRDSAEGASPLTAILLINPITRAFNECRVKCSDVVTSESLTTIVHVMDRDYRTPEFNISSVSEQFKSNDVIVTIEWIAELESSIPVVYNISIFPRQETKQVIMDRFNGNTTHNNIIMAQLTVSYNTLYNVSISAAVSCGLNTTTSITLNYASCGYPNIRDPKVSTSHGKGPLLEGTIVNFTCPNNLDLIGPTESTCAKNGEWEPDAMEVECRGLDHVTTTCQPSGGDLNVNNTCPNSFVITDSPVNTIILWSSIGGVVASVCVILIVIVILTLLMIKRKGLNTTSYTRDGNNDTNQDLNYYDEMNSQSQVVGAESLVYADINPSSLKPSRIHCIQDIDDYHVEYAQLNKDKLEESQKALEHKTNGNIHHSTVAINLDILLIKLRSVVLPHWYQFGQAIRIKEEILDDFAQKCSPEECIVETFDYWLRNHEGQPTWREVAEALKAINLTDAAKDIETMYSIGTHFK